MKWTATPFNALNILLFTVILRMSLHVTWLLHLVTLNRCEFCSLSIVHIPHYQKICKIIVLTFNFSIFILKSDVNLTKINNLAPLHTRSKEQKKLGWEGRDGIYLKAGTQLSDAMFDGRMG